MEIPTENIVFDVASNFLAMGLTVILLFFFKDYKLYGKWIALQNSIVISLYIVLSYLLTLTILVYLSDYIKSQDILYNIIFTFLFSFIPLSKLSIWYWREFKAGKLLLSLEKKPNMPFSFFLIGTVFLVTVFYYLIPTFVLSTEINILKIQVSFENILSFSYLIFATFCYCLWESGNIEIREKGIEHRNYYLPWKHIEIYEINENKNILNIQHRALYPLSRYLEIMFAPELKKDLVQMLSQHCREANQ